MKLLEFQAKRALAQSGIAIPRGQLVNDAFRFTAPVILKVQVASGKRGLRGGIVKVARQEAFAASVKRLKTLEFDGERPSAILAEEIVSFHHEHYLSLLVDRDAGDIIVLAKKNGGMEVEDSDEEPLRLIVDENFDSLAKDVCMFYGYDDKKSGVMFKKLLRDLYRCMAKNDALLLEINPLVIVDGTPVALDCKMEVDDNSLFRHPDFATKKPDANFVTLNKHGRVAVVANGAGLAMATVDHIENAGLSAINFLDIGGGADTARITANFARLMDYPHLGAIIVNIFAGITRCDEVAEAIIAARKSLELPPLFIRLYGTNFDKAKVLLANEDIPLFENLTDCVANAKDIL